MVLLDAMARARAHEIAGVATFDHGTGAAATRASTLVERTALALELPVVRGAFAADSGTRAPAGTEAAWREARWRFLNGWADELGAVVLTAHTRDDQIETVVQRLLRDAGVRGLAAMRDEGPGPMGVPVARPFLSTPRAALAAYATSKRVPFVEDPSNASRAHQRNVVRLDLLPAIERAVPDFGDWCLGLAARAAAWRTTVDACVDALGVTVHSDGAASVRARAVKGYGQTEWEVLWPAIAARIGVTMDRRGIARASSWAPGAVAGQQIPLAGAVRIERTASSYVIRRVAEGTP